jgi:hypothetical protein
MSHSEFDQLLSNLNGLTPQQLAVLQREVASKLAAPPTKKKLAIARPLANRRKSAKAEPLTAYQLLSAAGLIGCVKGKAGSPTDLATNPKHMEGFGSD